LPDLVTKKSKKVRPSDKKPYLVTRKVNKTDAVPKKAKKSRPNHRKGQLAVVKHTKLKNMQ